MLSILNCSNAFIICDFPKNKSSKRYEHHVPNDDSEDIQEKNTKRGHYARLTDKMRKGISDIVGRNAAVTQNS